MRLKAAACAVVVTLVAFVHGLPFDVISPSLPQLLSEDASRIRYNGKVYVLEEAGPSTSTPKPTSKPSIGPTPAPTEESCAAEKALTPADGMEFFV